jgi:hypothetical protein
VLAEMARKQAPAHVVVVTDRMPDDQAHLLVAVKQLLCVLTMGAERRVARKPEYYRPRSPYHAGILRNRPYSPL